MKYSKAMLKGFQKVEGRQCTRELARDESGRAIGQYDDRAKHPHSVCVQGAALLGATGRAEWFAPGDRIVDEATDRFEDVWGIHPVTLNNGSRAMKGLPWEHIYGMARAIGL